MDVIFDKLEGDAKEWAKTLNPDEIAKILQASYMSKKTQTISHTQAPAELGQIGEKAFADICKDLPSNYKLIDTTKTGKKGDFILTYEKDGSIKKCLIDVKNYTTTIPKKEIEKFMEDLSAGVYDAGLMISYGSKFVGIPDAVYLTDINLPNGKLPIMYVAMCSAELIVQAIQILMLRTQVHIERDVDLSRIESLIELINSAISQSSDTRRLLNELNSHVSKTIQRCGENLIGLEIQVKKAIREMSSAVSRGMVNKVMKHVPKIDARDDNVDPEVKIERSADKVEAAAESTLPNSISGSALPSDRSSSTEFLQHVRPADRSDASDLLELEWDDKEESLEDKPTAELTGKNLVIMLCPLKTKTTAKMYFTEEIEIESDDLEDLTYTIKDDVYICILDDKLVSFVKKYMG